MISNSSDEEEDDSCACTLRFMRFLPARSPSPLSSFFPFSSFSPSAGGSDGEVEATVELPPSPFPVADARDGAAVTRSVEEEDEEEDDEEVEEESESLLFPPPPSGPCPSAAAPSFPPLPWGYQTDRQTDRQG